MNTQESKTPTSEEIISNAWQEASRQMEHFRCSYPNSKIQISEIQDNENSEVHHLVIIEESSHNAVIIRAELTGDYNTRFLRLPGDVVDALQIR